MKTIRDGWQWALGAAALLTLVLGAATSSVLAQVDPAERATDRPAAEREGGGQAAGAQRERAGEAADIQRRLEQLEGQIRELRQLGRQDAAEERQREFQALRQRLEQLRSGAGQEGQRAEIPAEVRARLQNLRTEIQKLREAGENEKATQLEQEARAILARYSFSPGDPRERLQHLRVAAEHLRLAGAADLAERVAQHAQQLEQQLRAGGQLQGDRPQGDRPQGDRPQGDRPLGDRPPGELDQPQGERVQPERD